MNIAKGHRLYGAWAPGPTFAPGAALLLPIRPTTQPYAGLAHVYTDRVVRNVFHDVMGKEL